MKVNKFKLAREISVAPFVAVCLSSPFASTQTPQTASETTTMPQEHMKTGMMRSDAKKKSMLTGLEEMQKMPMSGYIDKDFATTMKMHHQQDVDVAQMDHANGKSPAMKLMAKYIFSAQRMRSLNSYSGLQSRNK